MLPMVKADAYGLGLEEAVRAVEPAEPWGYGVATVEEGARVRGAGTERPVLVVSPVSPGTVEAALGLGLTLSVSDLHVLEAIVETAWATLDVEPPASEGILSLARK